MMLKIQLCNILKHKKMQRVILNCNNISLYFWSNKCSLGEHKNIKINLTNPKHQNGSVFVMYRINYRVYVKHFIFEKE